MDKQSTKLSINQELKSLFAKEMVLTLSQARQARREGFLKRAASDLYENVATKDFWKINKSNGTIERLVRVDDKGITKE